MPDNPRIVPAASSCFLTNAFLEGPGHGFWESPGRVRRSGANPQPMYAKTIRAVKAVFGFTGVSQGHTTDLGEYPWLSDPYEAATRRWMSSNHVITRDLLSTYYWGTASNNSSISNAGVPTHGEFHFPQAGLDQADIDHPSNHIFTFFRNDPHSFGISANPGGLYHTDNVINETAFDVQWFHDPAKTMPSQSVQHTLSGLNTPKPHHDLCRSLCEGFVFTPWSVKPTGSTSNYSFKDVAPQFVQPNGDYHLSDYSAFDGSLVHTRDLNLGTGFPSNSGSPWSAWSINFFGLPFTHGAIIVEVVRSVVKFPDTDPLPQRKIEVIEVITRIGGTTTSQRISIQLIPRGSEYEIPIPDWLGGPVISRFWFAI